MANRGRNSQVAVVIRIPEVPARFAPAHRHVLSKKIPLTADTVQCNDVTGCDRRGGVLKGFGWGGWKVLTVTVHRGRVDRLSGVLKQMVYMCR